MNQYVWALSVEYPDAAYRQDERDRELFGDLDPNWKPEDWNPDEDYLERYGDDDFRWPKVERIYRSRDAAVRRAQLLERYGAIVKLLRSAPLTFEERTFPGVLQRASKAAQS